MDTGSHSILIRKKALALTLLAYKAADLLPKEESLRHDIKKYALSLLGAIYTLLPLGEALAKIFGGLDACLHVAGSFSKYDFIDFKMLRNAYSIIYRAVMCPEESDSDKAKPVSVRAHVYGASGQTSKEKDSGSAIEKTKPTGSLKSLPDRQRLILQFAKFKNRFQLKDLMAEFPSYSEKTIRNDLGMLCERRLVGRFGIAPRSYYEVTHHAVIQDYRMERMRIGAETTIAGSKTSVEHAEVMR